MTARNYVLRVFTYIMPRHTLRLRQTHRLLLHDFLPFLEPANFGSKAPPYSKGSVNRSTAIDHQGSGRAPVRTDSQGPGLRRNPCHTNATKQHAKYRSTNRSAAPRTDLFRCLDLHQARKTEHCKRCMQRNSCLNALDQQHRSISGS